MLRLRVLLASIFHGFLKSEEIVLAVSPLLVGNLGRGISTSSWKEKRADGKTAAHKVWRSKTSRGEQLLRRNWEEAAKCISCVHYDAFFTGGHLVFVQCSYAGNALIVLPRQALGNTIYRYDITYRIT